MANKHWLKKPVGEYVIEVPADASLGIDIGDLMYYDSNDAKPASSQADQLSEPKNQLVFAQNFLGIANSARLSSDTVAGVVRVQVDGYYEFTVTSATFEPGDYVGADEVTAGTSLEDQSVKKVTLPHLAIGVVVERYSAATTSVWCRLMSRVCGDFGALNQTLGGFQGRTVNTETLAADKTLDVDDAVIQALDPGGAGRAVNLPAEAASTGMMFWIVNTADAAEVLTVKNDGGGTIVTPTQNENAIVICDGTTWHGLVGAGA